MSGELLPALDGINENRGAHDARRDVPPADTIAESLRERKQKEAQHQHEGDVRVAQGLGGDNGKIGERPRTGDGGVEVEEGVVPVEVEPPQATSASASRINRDE